MSCLSTTLTVVIGVPLIPLLILNLNLLLIVFAHDAHLSLTTVSGEVLFLVTNLLLLLVVVTTVILDLTLLAAFLLIVFSITSILWMSVSAR